MARIEKGAPCEWYYEHKSEETFTYNQHKKMLVWAHLLHCSSICLIHQHVVVNKLLEPTPDHICTNQLSLFTITITTHPISVHHQ